MSVHAVRRGFFEDFYFLGGDSTGTMERISWVAESPKAPREWRPLLRSLVEGFTGGGAKVVRNNDSTYAILQLPDRSISIELYFDFQKRSIRRLTVECMSAHLAEAAESGELLVDESDLDSAYVAEAAPEVRGDEDINEGMSFRVIEAGERFLREHRGSEKVPEVELAIAQAHETIWCLASISVQYHEAYDSEDFRRIRKEGSSHRVPAIVGYQRFLAARPESPAAPIIRKRLIRLRNAIDTGYYKYWFPGG